MNFGGTISNNFLQTAGSFTVISGGSTITGSATINGGALDLTGNRLNGRPTGSRQYRSAFEFPVGRDAQRRRQ